MDWQKCSGIKRSYLDFRPLRKFYPKPVQRTGFCGFSE
ncbi:hypothetical protein SD15574_0017 [Shigella dysenteriae 155-74]|nr:hypothetical protein SD15574_0017 [Shigella dysenteriae 155-74]EIQ22103.1 hypothetical protein SB96558_5390 [Shigella boydii 965-58]